LKVRIGTRGSDLALWQARFVASQLVANGAECELVVLKTRGDLIDDVPLAKVEGKAFFTAEIERALLADEVDIAVHSHKDLPTENTPGLTIAAVPARGPQAERLVIAPAAHDASAAFLPVRRGARVGTSAPRRAEQLRALRPDLDVLDLRGNVPTRVRKLREGHYDAIVLAAAGLDRLKLSLDGLVAFDLPLDLFVPAPAQGALAIQARAADTRLIELCRRCLHDETTARSIAAERSLLAAAGGGCSLPLGASVEAWTNRRREGARAPEPQAGGLNRDAAGITDSGLSHTPNATSPASRTVAATAPTSFRARAFLGAGHPRGAAHGRWAFAVDATPERAIAAAYEQLAHGAPTDAGPLAPLSIALTGSASDGSALGERLAALGARVVLERVIDFEPLDGVDIARELAALHAGDVLAITSRQTARLLAGHALPHGVTVAAVGPASARALAAIGMTAHVVGHGGARELGAALEVARGAKVLFPCAHDALRDLEDELAKREVAVRRVELYRTITRRGVALDEHVDLRVYMSPSAVEATLAWEREHTKTRTRRFALGHTTAAALDAAGLASQRPTCSDGSVTDELIRQIAQLCAQPPSLR
jgi:hydroxymethylbilane synthase